MTILGYFLFWFWLLREFPRWRVNFGIAIFMKNFSSLIDNFLENIFVLCFLLPNFDFNFQKLLEKHRLFLTIFLFDFDLYENFHVGGSILDSRCLRKSLESNFDFLISKNDPEKVRQFLDIFLFDFCFYDNFHVGWWILDTHVHGKFWFSSTIFSRMFS